MRTFFVVIGMFFVLNTAASAAEVVSGSGAMVVSSSGAPVTQGGFLVESEHEGRSSDTGGRGRSEPEHQDSCD